MEQLGNARSPMWNQRERGMAKLIDRRGLAVGLWGDASLVLGMLEKFLIAA